MRWSIRNQVLVPLAVLVVGTFGVSAWSAYAAADRARTAIHVRVAGVARTLSAPHFPLTQPVLERIKGLTGADLILDSGPDKTSATIDVTPAEVASITSNGNADSWHGPRATLGGRSYLCDRIQLPAGHPNAGGTLFVLYPQERFDAEVRDAAGPPLIWGFGGGIVAVGLMIGVGRRLIGRLRELDRQTRRIADGDFAPMPLSSGSDELRDLSQSVNEMAERLREAQTQILINERMRLLGQLSGGLAHQLRNAIAGAKLAVQLHSQECESDDDESLKVAHRQLGRIEADIERFLSLGQSAEMVRRPIPIVPLVDQAVALLQHQCRHARIEFRCQTTNADPTVIGDPAQIEHLLLNLLNNAIEAAGVGGSIEITIRHPQPEVCVIEVADSGAGPPLDIADRLFEPFITRKPDGIGLGLYVAQQAAAAHGGRLDWRRQNELTIFRCELPAVCPNSNVNGTKRSETIDEQVGIDCR